MYNFNLLKLKRVLKPLKNIITTLQADFAIIFERDPAARNWLEVLLCYPGLHAIALYRFAHWLNMLKLPI
ncbi:MAG: serine O-acetyltransferase, partial [Pseudanabaena sp.]